jgi:hypothetical protein
MPFWHCGLSPSATLWTESAAHYKKTIVVPNTKKLFEKAGIFPNDHIKRLVCEIFLRQIRLMIEFVWPVWDKSCGRARLLRNLFVFVLTHACENLIGSEFPVINFVDERAHWFSTFRFLLLSGILQLLDSARFWGDTSTSTR